jgi:CBS domain-containing protein
MDCVYASGGAEGWRSIFASALECDDVSDTGSVGSFRSVPRSVKSGKSGKTSHKKDVRPVCKLRPKKPTLVLPTESVLAVTRALANTRGDAALLVDASGTLVGVITDTDITRRLVAKQLPSASTHASAIMTPNPTCVSMSDSAMDALVIMVENRFRHLPVVDDNGSVVGCLDIAKCLNDAITKLERAQEKSGTAASDAAKLFANMQGGNNAALQMLLAQAFGGKSSPTLRSVLAGKPSTIVSPQSTLQTVGLMMTEARKAALVVDDNELVGIFGFKDMMTRAVAKDLPLDTTTVSSVMTPNPECVSPETTVLEALQIMHDNKFLTLPVCEATGRVVGLVDVMDCVYASGGAEGWKSLFDSALNEDDVSSVYSTEDSVSRVLPRVMVASHPNNIPLHVEVGKNSSGDDVTSVGESLTQAHPNLSVPSTPEPTSRKSFSNDNLVAYKVVDRSGHTYIIRAGRSVESIANALEGKVPSFDPSMTLFKYFDEEGDEILIKTDECLEEAVASSIQAGNKSVKLSMISMTNSSSNSTLLIAGGVGLIAAIGAMVFMKSKK